MTAIISPGKLDGQDQTITPQILANLMTSLWRVFKIAVYYPDGHPAADQTLASFSHALNRVVGKKEIFLQFNIDESGISLQGIELDINLSPVAYFHDLLHELSISSLAIHRDITTAELRHFISRILFLRAEAKSSRSFRAIEMSDLPETIRTEQKKFLSVRSASDDEGSGDSSHTTIDYLLSALKEHGLKQQQLAMCRDLLESIPATLEERTIKESDLPSVTWSDVEILLRRAADSIQSSKNGSAAKDLSGKSYNIDILVAILKSFDNTDGRAKSHEAIDLLVKLTKGTSVPSKLQKPLSSRGEAGINITPDTIKKILPAMHAYHLPDDLRENDRREELSILIQMLGRENRLQAVVKTHELLRAALHSPLDPDELRIVIYGMRHLLTKLDDEELRRALLMILEIIRRSGFTSPLSLLLEVSRGLAAPEFVLLWPYMVNEILIEGPSRDPKLFHHLCLQAARLPIPHMRKQLPLLRTLEACSKKRISANIFSPPPAELHALFRLLLGTTDAKYLYERLINGLRQKAFCWLDEAVAPLLDHMHPVHRQFISQLLQQDDPLNPSPSLKKIGAGIIIESLPRIPEEQRMEEWIPVSIAALAKAKNPGAPKMLNGILKEKNFLVIPEWPGPARKAARETLTKGRY